MNRKRDISNFLIFVSLLLVALPAILVFNSFLTRVVERIELYNWIQNVIVPFQAQLVSMIVKLFNVHVETYASVISVNGISLTVTWNCLGWQSMLLFLISLFISLKGSSFTLLSKIQSIIIGIFGIFWINILRMSFTVLLAAYSQPIYKIVFHDYLAAFVTIFYLFLFWWFSYSYILEEKRANLISSDSSQVKSNS